MADEDKKTTEEVKAEEAPKEEATPAEAQKEADNKKEAAPTEETPEEKPAEEKKEDQQEAEQTQSEDDQATETAEENVAATETTEESTEEPVETEEVEPEEAAQKLDTGMVVRVHVKIKDVTPRGDERERIQVFEGIIINKGGQDTESATITVRKVSNGIGVERIFPVKMPAIEKIEVVKQYRTRRSKLNFLRDKKFKKKMREVKKD